MKKNEDQVNTPINPANNPGITATPEKTEVKNANASGQGAFERSGEDLDKAPEENDDDEQVY